MKTKEEILEDIFYKPETQDWYKPVVKAMELYANEKLKGLLEEVREIETDPINGYYSIYVSACNTIATRIEELIGENTKPNTPP